MSILFAHQFQFSETKSNFPAILGSKLALLAEMIREALLKTLSEAAELACTLKQFLQAWQEWDRDSEILSTSQVDRCNQECLHLQKSPASCQPRSA